MRCSESVYRAPHLPIWARLAVPARSFNNGIERVHGGWDYSKRRDAAATPPPPRGNGPTHGVIRSSPLRRPRCTIEYEPRTHSPPIGTARLEGLLQPVLGLNYPASLVDYPRFAEYAQIVANPLRLARPVSWNDVEAPRPRFPAETRLKLVERISLEVTISPPRS